MKEKNKPSENASQRINVYLGHSSEEEVTYSFMTRYKGRQKAKFISALVSGFLKENLGVMSVEDVAALTDRDINRAIADAISGTTDNNHSVRGSNIKALIREAIRDMYNDVNGVDIAMPSPATSNKEPLLESVLSDKEEKRQKTEGESQGKPEEEVSEVKTETNITSEENPEEAPSDTYIEEEISDDIDEVNEDGDDKDEDETINLPMSPEVNGFIV